MTKHRVLVVDDDEDIRESLMDFLEENGYAPVGARNGRDALTKLSATARPPSVILLDLMMPIMDGRAFREEQLLDPSLAAIPVVTISAHRSVGPLVADEGIRDHLTKPLDLDVLLAVLGALCARD